VLVMGAVPVAVVVFSCVGAGGLSVCMSVAVGPFSHSVVGWTDML
jgi:hypothetical protein